MFLPPNPLSLNHPESIDVCQHAIPHALAALTAEKEGCSLFRAIAGGATLRAETIRADIGDANLVEADQEGSEKRFIA